MKRLFIIKIYGRVQGVFFRDSTKQEADKLGIKGFIRNESDSSVYIEAESEEGKLKEFLEWCRKGPALSLVAKVDFEIKNEIKGFRDFVIE